MIRGINLHGLRNCGNYKAAGALADGIREADCSRVQERNSLARRDSGARDSSRAKSKQAKAEAPIE
jgi:hypothetical protein